MRSLSWLAALALALLLAACGGSSETSSPTPSSAASNEQDAARVKLLQCAREQGIDVPDTEGTGEAFAQLSPADRERLEAAMQGPCQEHAAQAFGTSGPHGQDSEEFLDALTSFTACLRENGADVPDPDPNSPFSVLHSLDQSDPTIAAAIAACRDKLNGGR